MNLDDDKAQPNYALAFVRAVESVKEERLPVFYPQKNSKESLEYCQLLENRYPVRVVGTANQISIHISHILRILNIETFSFPHWEASGMVNLIERFLAGNKSYPAYIGTHRWGKSAGRILEISEESITRIDYFDHSKPVELQCCPRKILFTPSKFRWQLPKGTDARTGFVRFRKSFIGGSGGVQFTRYREDFGMMDLSFEYAQYAFAGTFPARLDLEVKGQQGISMGKSLSCSVIIPIVINKYVVDAVEYMLWFFFYPGSGGLARIAAYWNWVNPTYAAHPEEGWLEDLEFVRRNASKTMIPFQ